MTELTPGNGLADTPPNKILPDGAHECALYAQTLNDGVELGRESMKTDVLLAIGGCLSKDPTLQKLVAVIEELK